MKVALLDKAELASQTSPRAAGLSGQLRSDPAMTRIAALAFALFCALTAVLFHWNFAVHNELLHFEKDLAIAGGFLVLAAAGPGRWSLDQWRSRLAD